MSNTNTTQTKGGVGFLGLLQILFIGLKLTGFISWSWWWVLSPIWIGASLWVILLLIIILAAIVSKG